ncbi:MAG: phosphate/phosphite/phosphonate ABC transporter substrate-binding protein [Flavobacteriaceae bacterium]|nr:phosphate/phosphite/phosphonate ABC transporter substrate-binding protein [Flavobacteriaceae bacterium]
MKSIILPFCALVLVSCNFSNQNQKDTTVVDFSEQSLENINSTKSESNQKLRVAVSAIITPRETFIYYEDLLNYITEKLHYHIEFKQRKTYEEVNKLLANNEVDLAFICSGAYVIEKDKNNIELLAVPVTNGRPFYQAYIIVHKSSNIENFEQLKGKKFTYTDPLSNTGKLYAEIRIKELGYDLDTYFDKTIYSYAHDASIQLVAKKMVDGATIDGLIFEYLAKFYPEKVKNIKIIEKSEDYGIPPIVVPTNIDPKIKLKLKNILLNLHNDSIGKKILNKLLIDKFIEGDDENYNSIRKNLGYIK